MIPTDLPTSFKRLQISRKDIVSQRQTCSMIGIDLRKECSSHGQLYVALSRVGSPENQYVLLPPT